MIKYLFFSVFILSSCVFYQPSVELAYVGEYGNVYEAKCDGSSYTMAACYQLANQKCLGQLKILHKSEKTYHESADTDDGLSDISTTVRRNILFYCKK